MPTSMHQVTAESRAKELSDEFIVKNKQLFCKWCQKVIHSLRRDNITEHLHSRIHQHNRMENGMPMSFDPDSPKTRLLKEKRRKARDKHKVNLDSYNQVSQQGSRTQTSYSHDEGNETESDEDLLQLFGDSSSEETESFEGFDESAVFEVSSPKRGSRPRKRPARLSDSVSSAVSGKRTKSSSSSPRTNRKSLSSLEDSLSPVSPLSIRSLPLKKQISYSARVSSALSSAKTTKKGALKIKISRKPKQSPESLHADSSETEDTDQVAEETHSSHDGESLKMKFVLNKPQVARNLQSKHPENRSDAEVVVSSPERLSSSPSAADLDNESTDCAADEELAEEQVVEESVVTMEGEVVEEEIVGVDEGEVVSWDDVVTEEVIDDDTSIAIEDIPEVNKATEEETLAKKVSRARKMAKSVNSAQFKKKRLSTAKKLAAKQANNQKQKKKVTGYMLWSGKMRKQVASQYPGLQFGEVSKKLGDLWKRIPDKEKQMWKNRGVKWESQLGHVGLVNNKRRQGSKMIETGPKKKPVAQRAPPKRQLQIAPLPPFPPHKNPQETMRRELNRLPTPALEPIDAAAYFHLLGESLLDMGKKAKTSGNGSSLGSTIIPTMLDSLLCSMAPLLCLVNEVPELQGSVSNTTMSGTLANVSHYIPGV